MRINFLGASKTVTGSSYLLEVNGRKFLVDCGLFQGSKVTEAMNRRPFPYQPAEIDFVLLTHAHIDHCGMLPKLCKQGFRGNIHATKSTVDLCRIMLPDSGHIQEFEAEISNRKGRRAGTNFAEPLYTVEDAYNCLKQFVPQAYNEKIALTPEVTVRFNEAGHILGSAIIELWITEGGRETKLVFSGDLGRREQPIIKDPAYIDEADYVVIESTYGSRRHEEFDREAVLAQVINDTVARGGNVVIPAFAVGRTQMMVYYLHKLLKAGKIPDLPVFIDSPLAISATDIFSNNYDDFDPEAYEMLREHKGNPQKLLRLFFTRTAEESKTINQMQEPAIILSASGMADAGRILHHLKHNLWRPESSVLLVGYQGQSSLGRRLLDGVRRVRIMGEEIGVRAKIYNLEGFSAHADQGELLNWLEHFRTAPANVFIVHGEPESSEALGQLIKTRLNLASYIPAYGDEATISGREYSIASSRLAFADPVIQKLQELLEVLDSEFMELRKRFEQAVIADSGEMPAVSQWAGKLRKLVRQALEALGNGRR